MSRPKTRAVPAAGAWKPIRVLISVDFPAPLGPSSPMVRAERAHLRSCSMRLPPRSTERPSSSTTGCIVLIESPYYPMLLPHAPHLAQQIRNLEGTAGSSQHIQIEPEETSGRRDLDTVRLAVGVNQAGAGVGAQRIHRALLIRRQVPARAQGVHQRAKHRSDVLIQDRREVRVPIGS